MQLKARNPSKAKMELFMLLYSPVWMGVMAVVVIFKWYESFTPTEYITLGVFLALPCISGPLLLARGDKEESKRPLLQRYSVKANVFIAIISYIGHHFYTQYFYRVLGMRYTGPLAPGQSIDINGSPLSMLFFTHVYFMSYHVLVSPLLRAVRSLFPTGTPKFIATAIFVMLISIFTAFAETWTISGFPYYTYPDFTTMLTIGSVFYATFFMVTFPWFFAMDEDPRQLWPVATVIVAALAAMMVVLLCADFWRLTLTYFDLVPSGQGSHALPPW